MAEVTFDVKPATPQKRAFDDSLTLNEETTTASATRLSLTDQHAPRQGSPAPSSASSLTELSSTSEAVVAGQQSLQSSGPAAKKRKLGFIEQQAEKAAKKREKEEKERVKAEEKQRKQEERARKDEEKRRKAEEKEAEKRAKDLERAKKQAESDEKKKARDAVKAEKEAKKAREEEEKLKKERAQMRLVAFFGKPKPEATPPSTPDNASEGALSRRSSIASIDMEKPAQATSSLSTTGPANPEYEKWILPFFIPEHTDVAPNNRFKLGRQPDFTIKQEAGGHIDGLRGRFLRSRRRAKNTLPVKEIVQSLQASGLDAIELETSGLDALRSTPYKILQFREDVRPPYRGTYTRHVSSQASRKLARNPFSRNLPDTNYDYDSEAEWEPPGDDDEDLGDDDEISDADEAEDEMADFLDDAEDVARRKGPLIDMEPVSTGLCWVGEAFDDKGLNLGQYRMDFLHDSTRLPIDPFSAQHWIDEAKPKATIKQETSATTMQPPASRQPLSTLSPNACLASKQGIGVNGKPLPPGTPSKFSGSGKPQKLVPPELMRDFKKAIEGSPHTKTGLIEVLKKQFTQCSKDAIKASLEAVATREGKKESEKRWVLIEA